MEAWKSVVALAVAGVFATGPAWAQTSPPAPADKSTMDKTDKSTMDKAGKMDHKAGMMDKAGHRDHVKAIQQALKDKGHDPGAVDGVMGAKTKAALKDFQKAQGLEASGRLDHDTMTKLGVDMKTSAAGASAPSASPATEMKSEAPKADASKDAVTPSASPATTTEAPKADEAPKANEPKPADTTKPVEEKK